MKIVLVTDTLCDLNGVSRFLQDMARIAYERGDALYIVTSTKKNCAFSQNIQNLPPVFAIPMPMYPELDLAFPPRSKIAQCIKELDPDIMHISTPGPLGYVALKVAKKLGVKVIGTYHTDFPAYIQKNTGSKFLKKRTDGVMRGFYKNFSLLFTRSKEYTHIINKDLKFQKEAIAHLTPGTDLNRFHPSKKQKDIYKEHKNKINLLYVGRISKEKNIPFLLRVWGEVIKVLGKEKAHLHLVGEGKLIKKYSGKIQEATFHGPIVGERLYTMYASSDFFLFPSVTDTLGQVVMEAQASGMGVMIADEGGPQSLINLLGKPTGIKVRANEHKAWLEQIICIIEDEQKRLQYNSNAREAIESLPIEHSYEQFIRGHKEVYEGA